MSVARWTQYRGLTVRTAMLAILLGVGGCVPLPFVLPPIGGSAGLGPSFGHLQSAPDLAPQATGARLSEELRILARPLAAVPSLLDRPIDIGIGYKAQHIAAASNLPEGPPGPWFHGPSFEFRVFPWQQLSGKTVLRLAIVTHLDLLGVTTDQGFLAAGGGDVGIELSLSHFSSASPTVGGNGQAALFGMSWGEVGVGAAITGGSQSVAGQHFGYGMLSLTAQLPAAIGVALIPVTSLFR